jgi:hypothetical protein
MISKLRLVKNRVNSFIPSVKRGTQCNQPTTIIQVVLQLAVKDLDPKA